MSYRNIFYDSRKKSIRLWAWDDTGQRVERVEPFKPYLFVESNHHHDALSIFNTSLKRLDFPCEFDRKRYIQNCGIKRLFYNLRPEQQYLIDKFPQLEEFIDFEQYPLKTYYIDIETESIDSFPDIQKANHPISLISVYDSFSQKYYTFGLKHPFNTTRSDVVYCQCKTESELLTKFLDFWKADYCDVLTGYNSEQFDIPYIINRIKNILGEDAPLKLSPVNSLYYREDVRSKFGRDLGRWHIRGLSCIDYLEAYKTFSPNKLESYSLNYVAEHELKEGKTLFNAPNLAKLAAQNWDDFVKYNLQDVSLLVKLEKKLNFLKIMRMIAYKGSTTLESSMGKISVISGAIARQALKAGKIIPTFEHEEMGGYSGGYVKEVEPGIKESVMTLDVNSLYPNTIITLNLSLETKIGKVVSETDNSVEIRLSGGQIHNISKDKFNLFLNKEKISLSKAGVLYSQKEKGIIPLFVDNLYAERVKLKKEMLKLEMANSRLDKKSNEYKENATKIGSLNLQQTTLKLLLNSIYGVFANKASPLYDIDHASSITNTGQAVIKTTSQIVDEYLKQTYITIGDYSIYGDTDSCHVTLQPLLDKFNQSFYIEGNKINPFVYEKANEIQKIANDGIKKWAIETLRSIDPRFVFKREAICPTAIYQSKKHYILHVRDKGETDPIPCDKIKYVGIEIVKGIMSKKIKKMIEKVIETIVYQKDATKTNEVYKQVYEEFLQLPIEEIAFRTGLSDYNKFARKANQFEIAKRTPAHAKAAIHYNLLLKEYDADQKYDPIGSGQKIKWFYTLPDNKYNIECIAFVDKFPTEFIDIKPNYQVMFSKLVASPIQRFYDCVGWKNIDFNNEYTCDLFDLLKETS